MWQKKKSCWASRSHPIWLHFLDESLQGGAAGGKQLPGGSNKGESHEGTAHGTLPYLRLDLRILPPAVNCLTPKLLTLEIKGSAGRMWASYFPKGQLPAPSCAARLPGSRGSLSKSFHPSEPLFSSPQNGNNSVHFIEWF